MTVRYGRQTRLPEIGQAGQERLGVARVAAGAEGEARDVEVAYLAAAGIPVIADADSKSDATAKAQANAEAKSALAALAVKDPSARQVADGAMRALLAMRRILGVTG